MYIAKSWFSEKNSKKLVNSTKTEKKMSENTNYKNKELKEDIITNLTENKR